MIPNLLVLFSTTVFFTITTTNNNNGRKLLVICMWNVSCWLSWPARSVFIILPRWGAWHYTHCVFVSFSRSRSQTAARRWVWRVIPLHLSINLETISSVPLQNVKASLSRRWVHHLLSKTFPRVSIKNTWTHHVPLFSIALPSFSINAGPRQWVNAVEWVVLYAVCKRAEKLCVWKLQDVTGSFSLSLTSLCIGCDGACARALLSNRKWDTWRDDPASVAITVSLPERELGSPITPALAN